jgi:hypothetical protein
MESCAGKRLPRRQPLPGHSGGFSRSRQEAGLLCRLRHRLARREFRSHRLYVSWTAETTGAPFRSTSSPALRRTPPTWNCVP